uniref:Uncharacterized protein n=1 Tax=Alexandrium monilatum TaxID=311494 RepID=A0A7S4Q5Z8_9DINO
MAFSRRSVQTQVDDSPMKLLLLVLTQQLFVPAGGQELKGDSFKPLAAGTMCSLKAQLSYGWGDMPLQVCFEHCLKHPECTHFNWLPGSWCHRYRNCEASVSPSWSEGQWMIYEVVRSREPQEPAAPPLVDAAVAGTGSGEPAQGVEELEQETQVPSAGDAAAAGPSGLQVPPAESATPGAPAAAGMGDPSCWFGDFTAALCCNLARGPRGAESCWDGVYTYARCCPGAASAGAAVSIPATAAGTPSVTTPQTVDCWLEVSAEVGNVKFNATDCCNTQHSPYGNLLCWGGDFTFERCCAQFHAQRCGIGRTLEAAQLTLALGLAWILVVLVLRTFGSAGVGGGGAEGGSAGEDCERLAVLDNAKFLLSVWVVASHLRLMPEAQMLLDGVCGDFAEFHTRTFCLVSGILSRDACSPRAMRGLAFRVVVPLLLWCIALEPLLLRVARGYPLLSAGLFARKVVDNVFHAEASRVIWYWFALVCWRLWACPLSALCPWARLIVALAISALAGYAKLGQTWVYYAKEGAFKMNMALACLPLFVVGQLLPLRWLLDRMPMTWVTMAVGAGLLSATYAMHKSPEGLEFMDDIPSFGWAHLPVQYCEPREAAALYWIRGLFKNALELTKGLIFLLLCCPRSNSILTTFGRHSIYPYLLHPVVLDWLGPVVKATPPACQLLVLPLVITAVLASWPVRVLFGPFLEPVWLERLLEAREGPECGGDTAHPNGSGH